MLKKLSLIAATTLILTGCSLGDPIDLGGGNGNPSPDGAADQYWNQELEDFVVSVVDVTSEKMISATSLILNASGLNNAPQYTVIAVPDGEGQVIQSIMIDPEGMPKTCDAYLDGTAVDTLKLEQPFPQDEILEAFLYSWINDLQRAGYTKYYITDNTITALGVIEGKSLYMKFTKTKDDLLEYVEFGSWRGNMDLQEELFYTTDIKYQISFDISDAIIGSKNSDEAYWLDMMQSGIDNRFESGTFIIKTENSLYVLPPENPECDLIKQVK